MNFSIIQKSQLEGANRLDAEYYQPEYLDIERTIFSNTFRKLNEICFFIKKGIFDLSPENYREKGIPLIRTSELNDPLIDFSTTVFLDIDTYNLNKATTLVQGDLAFTKIGANIGSVGLLPEDYPKYNFSQNIAGAHIRQGNVLSGYLLAFLLSKYGKKQIHRIQMISGQSKLELKDIRNLKIIVLHDKQQQLVNELIKESQKNRKEFVLLYSQSENLLLDELGLADFQIPDDLSFEVNFSEVKKANRMDADYFQPKYEKLVSKLTNQNAKPLLNVIKNVAADFDPSSKPDESFKYVELSNINTSIGTIDGYSEVLGKEAPGRAKRVLSTGDVIVSSVEGSLGKVALVDDEQKGYLASTGFFQFRSDEILPEVLLVLAKSMIFHMQLEKETAGTILTAVPKDAIKNIFVPVLSMGTQQKIADLVKKSHEARKRSKELLEAAKRKVEEMIENGGKN